MGNLKCNYCKSNCVSDIFLSIRYVLSINSSLICLMEQQKSIFSNFFFNSCYSRLKVQQSLQTALVLKSWSEIHCSVDILRCQSQSNCKMPLITCLGVQSYSLLEIKKNVHMLIYSPKFSLLSFYSCFSFLSLELNCSEYRFSECWQAEAGISKT